MGNESKYLLLLLLLAHLAFASSNSGGSQGLKTTVLFPTCFSFAPPWMRKTQDVVEWETVESAKERLRDTFLPALTPISRQRCFAFLYLWAQSETAELAEIPEEEINHHRCPCSKVVGQNREIPEAKIREIMRAGSEEVGEDRSRRLRSTSECRMPCRQPGYLHFPL